MANDVAVLICCHFRGGGATSIELRDMLQPLVRQRGHTGTIKIVKRLFDVPSEPNEVAARAAAFLTELGWPSTNPDVFRADFDEYEKFSIVIYASPNL